MSLTTLRLCQGFFIAADSATSLPYLHPGIATCIGPWLLIRQWQPLITERFIIKEFGVEGHYPRSLLDQDRPLHFHIISARFTPLVKSGDECWWWWWLMCSRRRPAVCSPHVTQSWTSAGTKLAMQRSVTSACWESRQKTASRCLLAISCEILWNKAMTWLCLCHHYFCFLAVFVCLSGQSFYDNISWTAWAMLMKLNREYSLALLMTCLDSGG